MNKLKMLVLTALAAVTVGTGALAAAPSASAMPISRVAFCVEIANRMDDAATRAEILGAAGLSWQAHYYWLLGAQYADMLATYCM